MPGLIRSNSAEVSQRRPVLGFTVRTGGHPYFEVAVATSPDLFRADARGRRTPSNFFSTRAGGPLPSERGEAVYLLPTDVLARFAGQERVFYAVATFADATRQNADVRVPAPEVAPFVTLSRSFAARPTRSVVGAGAGTRGGSAYGSPGRAGAADPSLEWAGDAAQPGAQPIAPAPSAGAVHGNGNGAHAVHSNGSNGSGSNGNGSSGNGAASGGGGAAAAPALAYDDGFDPDLWSRPMEAAVGSEDAADAAYGIEGPIPDAPEELAAGQAWSRAMTGEQPEYPRASRFVSAHERNFRRRSGTRTIRRIVIHITDGNRSINGPISWFRNPEARVSAHYIVGQDGEVVQMVRHDDVAWHAGSANGDSIGIEHVASRRRDIFPTDDEYCASAALVRWLCRQYGLPLDRDHIVGHREADTRTTHTGCPDSAWDWERYMSLVTSADALPCETAVAGAQAYGHGRASRALEVDPDSIGIDGPIPEDGAAAVQQGYGRAMTGPAPEYPRAARFTAAGAGHFTPGPAGRAVGRIVIHITDGTTTNGAVSWFQSPQTNVSSHYIVGQDGEVVQMVRHDDIAHHARGANRDSIGIENVASVRYNLWPTATQYCETAALVAWLCDTYGIPADRQHIMGHSEVGTSNHSDCPQARWDWTHFMNLVTRRECFPPPSAPAQGQAYGGRARVPVNRVFGAGQGYGGAPAGALDVVTPIYQPSDPAAAAQVQAEFQQRYNQWEAGVPDTSFFPHSAICHLFASYAGGVVGRGTGCYIAPDLILTCAHNVIDWDAGRAQPASIRIVPGQNGEHNKPFGEFTVRAGSWEYHPSYDGGFDFDLAVIRVSTPPPRGIYFDVLENLLVSQESPIIVCGYARIGDRFKQHLDGDHIRELSGNMERASYNLQTKVGTSGAPVYYVAAYEDHERRQSVQETRIVGVHVSGEDGVLNTCCRLTDQKINWIWEARNRLASAGSAGSLGYRGNGGYARPLAQVQNIYNPSDAAEAARVQAEWTRRRTAWSAGVPNTRFFPHSSICYLDLEFPSGRYGGTGFYIAPDRILTCAHNVVEKNGAGTVVEEATRVTVYPGRNGEHGTPFGSFAVSRADWEYHPRYDGGYDFDLAVLRVSTPPPHGSFFELEEQTMSVDSPLIVCGYSGETVNEYRQHLDSDMVREVWDETYFYNLQTEKGASGSPAYYVWGYEDEAAQMSIQSFRVSAVHIAPRNATLNRACRLTQSKLSWIRTRFTPEGAASYGLGHGRPAARFARPLSLSAFPLDGVATLEREFRANGALPRGTRKDCITIVNAVLPSIYGARITGPLGDRMTRTMAALEGMGLAGARQDFEFLAADGTFTDGRRRPDRLRDSLEDWMLTQAEANQQSAYYVFGAAVMHGYHSIMLVLAFSGRGHPDTQIYWCDQVHGGWDPVLGSLDARITSSTQGWWDAETNPRRKPRTATMVWPLLP